MEWLWGAIAGALSGGYVSHFLTNKRERNTFYLMKLETVISQFGVYTQRLAQTFVPLETALVGVRNFGHTLNLMGGISKSVDPKESKEMFVALELYFPSLHNISQQPASIYTKLFKVLQHCQKCSKGDVLVMTQNQRDKTLAELKEGISQIEAISQKFELDALELSKQYKP